MQGVLKKRYDAGGRIIGLPMNLERFVVQGFRTFEGTKPTDFSSPD